MKKLLLTLASMSLLVGMAACNNKKPSTQTPTSSGEATPSVSPTGQPSKPTTPTKPTEPTTPTQPTTPTEPTKPVTPTPSVGPVTPTPTPSKPSEGVTIKLTTTFNADYQAIIERAIARYEEEFPGNHVEYTKFNGGYSDLAQNVAKGFAAGDYPDMIACYPDSVADFIMAGRAMDMSKFMNDPVNGWTKKDLRDIPAVYLEESSNYFVEGTYSLPLCKSTEAMFYNKKIIGLDLSLYDEDINDGEVITEDYIENLTWEEMFNHLCPALIKYNEANGNSLIDTNNADYKDTWAVVGYDSDDNLFITLAEQYGYGYTSIDKASGQGSIDFVNDGMKGLMKWFNNAYMNHYFTTKGIVGKNVNYLSTVGSMLFSIGSTGGVKYQFSDTTKYDVGVAPIPHAEGGELKIINQGPSMSFLRRAQDADIYAQQCWNFYKIFTDTEFATDWAITTGYAPLRNSVADSDEFLNYSNENRFQLNTLDRLTARNARYAATMLDNLFSSPVFYGSSKARTAVGGLAADCIGNKGKVLTDEELNTYFQNAYANAL